MTQPPRILILDSGIGGLSVAKDIRQRLPNVPMRYFADLDGFPYGNKSEAEVVERVTTLVAQNLLIDHFDVVVVACNTASTAALEALRAKHSIPFVGVVPAIKPAALQSQTKSIAVLATEGTVNREYTKRLVQDFAQDCQVTLHGSGALVQMAEDKFCGLTPAPEAIARELKPIFQQPNPPDTVVLACTHFPLLKTELNSYAPNVRWIDSGEAIARRVEYWLKELGASLSCKETPLNQFTGSGMAHTRYDELCLGECLGRFERLSH